MIKKSWLVLVLISLQFMTNCSKESHEIDIPSNRVLILNEGTFNFGNASLSLYNMTENTIQNNIYKTINNIDLGDVAQSMKVIKDEIFIVVNNSAKIEILDKKTLKQKRTISIPNSSPRYIESIDDSTIIVTELYADKLWIIHSNSGNIIQTISTNGWTEQLQKVGTKIFIVQKKRFNKASTQNALLVYENNTLSTVQTSKEINSFCIQNNNLIALFSADNQQNLPAEIAIFNTTTNQWILGYQFAQNEQPSSIKTNILTNEIMFYMNGIYTYSNNAITKKINTQLTNFYAFDISPYNGDIYLSDAKDFVQSATISRYNAAGSKIHEFTSGVNSNNFLFIND